MVNVLTRGDNSDNIFLQVTRHLLLYSLGMNIGEINSTHRINTSISMLLRIRVNQNVDWRCILFILYWNMTRPYWRFNITLFLTLCLPFCSFVHSWFNSYARELVPTFYSAINHGYICFISWLVQFSSIVNQAVLLR